jgi:hypothetical protein
MTPVRCSISVAFVWGPLFSHAEAQVLSITAECITAATGSDGVRHDSFDGKSA